MKKITLLMSFLLTIFITKAQCDYYVVMQDAYGDGWNGASMDMSINGVVMTSFTVSTGPKILQIQEVIQLILVIMLNFILTLNLGY